MQDLIARLEAATGPDRELDKDIHHELGLHKFEEGVCDCDDRSPFYTDLFDHALLLVGDFDWEAKTAPHRKGGIARIVTMDQTIWAEAATPALALCIAALRARLA